MILLYIVLFIVACAIIGKLLNRSRDQNAGRFNQRPWTTSRTLVDPEENPRMVDDGTDFGYKEFD